MEVNLIISNESPPKYVPKVSVKEQFSLKDRSCLITGGAGFLGVQFAQAIAEMGGLPILLDINIDAIKSALIYMEEMGYKCDFLLCDISNEESIVELTKDLISRYSTIDILINNAALTKYGCEVDPQNFFSDFENTSEVVWNQGLHINLTGTMLMCKHIAPMMISRGKGSIINVGSDVGVISPDQRIYEKDESLDYKGVDFNTPAFYSVSKAGIIHLTKHLACLWASKGVRVNCFSPAGVYRSQDKGFVMQLTSRIPMGRMAAVNEFKGAIVFLASDASSFMTGHNLVMDGGRTVW
jgi:NAD(P)-dependent dehydrogenase (short-subunit alcohol dehydrogenase family)